MGAEVDITGLQRSLRSVLPLLSKQSIMRRNPFYYGIFEGGNRGLRRITGLFLPRGGEPPNVSLVRKSTELTVEYKPCPSPEVGFCL